MTKFQQYLANMWSKQELLFLKLNSGPTFLYLIIILLFVGEIFYLVNELSEFKEDYEKLITIADNLYLEVENLKQVGIPVTHEIPPSKVHWGPIVIICACVTLVFLLFGGVPGDGFTPSSDMVARVNDLGLKIGENSLVVIENITPKIDNHANNAISLMYALNGRITTLESLLHRIEDRIILTPGNQSVAEVFKLLTNT